MTQSLAKWKKVGRGITLSLCTLLILISPRIAQGGILASALPIELESRAYHLTFTPDGRYLVLVERPDNNVVLYDLMAKTIKFSTQIPHNVSDSTFSSRGNFLYLIGQTSNSGNTAVSRIFLPDGSVRTVDLDRQLDKPSIALGPSDRLLVAWYLARTLKQIPASLFETGPDGTPKMFHVGEDGNDVFIGVPPIARIESVSGGRTMFVSHASERAVSAINVETGRPIDHLWLDSKLIDLEGPPLDLLATSRQTNLEQRNSIIIADLSSGRLLLADVDEVFSSFDIIQILALKLPGPSNKIIHGKSRLLVASDAGQRAILVGSEASTEVLVYSRSARSLEVQNTIRLPFRPSALGVSPNGDIAAFADDVSGRLVIQAELTRRLDQELDDEEMERVREVQRQLSELGYPVGLVDGFIGSQTRMAIAHFQGQQGLQVTGTVDDGLLAALRHEVAVESGKRAQTGAEKEFVVVQAVVNPVVQSRNYSDAIRFCAEDEGCRSLTDGAVAFLKLSSEMVASALAAVHALREGEEGRYSIALPPGYEYCRSRIQTKAVVPPTGDRASVLGARSTKDGVSVYTWTPRSGESGASSWVEAEFTIYGVRQDVADYYRAGGVCRRHGQVLIDCRGAAGVNKGMPACTTAVD